MQYTINIEKKHFLIISMLLFLLVLTIFSTSLPQVDTNKAYHYIQQIALGPNDGNANENVSIDSDGDGIIDYAKDSDTLDGLHASEIGRWSPTAPTTGIFYDGGNVGIGTSNPLSRLHITRIGSDNIDVTNSLLYIRPSTQGYGLAMGVKQSYPPTLWMQGMVNDNPGAANIILNPLQGNVGIGTTSPSVKLEVNGYIKGTGLCIGNDCKTSWDDVGGAGFFVPTSIKATSSSHNANFGGHRAMYNWIQSNGCSGYHVCSSDEVKNYLQYNSGSVPIGWVNSPRYYFYYNSNYYNIDSCGEWTGVRWCTFYTGSLFENVAWSTTKPVLCCK